LFTLGYRNVFAKRFSQSIIAHFTMPKANAAQSLSKPDDIEMEEDAHEGELDALPTPDSNQEIPAPGRKGRVTRGRPKATATKLAKVKPASRRLSGRLAVVKKETPTQKRTATKRRALKGQKSPDHPQPEENGIEEDPPDGKSDGNETTASIDELVRKERAPKRGRPPKKQLEPEVVQETKVVENDGEFEYTPTVVRHMNTQKKSVQAKQAGAGKRNPSVDRPYASKVIPETQAMPMDLDSSDFPDEDADCEGVIPETVPRKPSGKRTNSRQRQPFLLANRAGSVSDRERAQDDSSTKRKLDEMTKKFEDLNMRYKVLKEVGVKEAQVNFEKLKEQSEVKTKGKRPHSVLSFDTNTDSAQLLTTSSML
jgi:hypothetical protein